MWWGENSSDEVFSFLKSNFLYPAHRDSLSAQLDLTVTKAESEQLARALQEEQYFELSQENKKAVTRHKQEIGEREATIARVSLQTHTDSIFFIPTLIFIAQFLILLT